MYSETLTLVHRESRHKGATKWEFAAPVTQQANHHVWKKDKDELAIVNAIYRTKIHNTRQQQDRVTVKCWSSLPTKPLYHTWFQQQQQQQQENNVPPSIHPYCFQTNTHVVTVTNYRGNGRDGHIHTPNCTSPGHHRRIPDHLHWHKKNYNVTMTKSLTSNTKNPNRIEKKDTSISTTTKTTHISTL